MRVVVTGATGNLGSAFVCRALAEGHDVVAVSRRPPPGLLEQPRLHWVHADLSLPDGVAPVASALRGADALVALAWALQPMRDRGYQRRVNLAGTTVCLAAAAHAGVPQAVVASSVAAYSPGGGEELVDEGWPTGGVPGCGYSHDKSVLEGVLADLTRGAATLAPRRRTRVAWVRPALVGQRAAGAELLRYGLPLLTPRRLVRGSPVIGVDRRLRLQVVHADDVADALVRLVSHGGDGPYNLAAGAGLDAREVAAAFGARPVHVPWRVLRGAASLAWHARVGPLEPGWITMAHTVPAVSTARARSELGWVPHHDELSTLAELVDGMAGGVGTGSATLRPSRYADDVRRLVRQGPVSDRSRP